MFDETPKYLKPDVEHALFKAESLSQQTSRNAVCRSFGHGLNKQLCQILHWKTNSVNSKGTAVSIKVL
jgi:hypothetical protein